MPSLKEITELATEMHDKKIINLDLTGRELLSIKAATLQSKGEEVGIYVLGGDHYVVVCGAVDPGSRINPAAISGPVR